MINNNEGQADEARKFRLGDVIQLPRPPLSATIHTWALEGIYICHLKPKNAKTSSTDNVTSHGDGKFFTDML